MDRCKSRSCWFRVRTHRHARRCCFAQRDRHRLWLQRRAPKTAPEDKPRSLARRVAISSAMWPLRLSESQDHNKTLAATAVACRLCAEHNSHIHSLRDLVVACRCTRSLLVVAPFPSRQLLSVSSTAMIHTGVAFLPGAVLEEQQVVMPSPDRFVSLRRLVAAPRTHIEVLLRDRHDLALLAEDAGTLAILHYLRAADAVMVRLPSIKSSSKQFELPASADASLRKLIDRQRESSLQLRSTRSLQTLTITVDNDYEPTSARSCFPMCCFRSQVCT